ncbi:tetratricopeptide repeat protein [Aliikangiella sp. G2MR2-5]|uniref:YfgM family protein n=1 Tax=Aliikangiella sp. G2MR2-5 TaxID=2788943 RepID=UPI0018A8C5E7
MSYETEEQQVERLKEWWKENGTPLIVGALLGLAGFGGWKYWNEQKLAYQQGASDAYLKVTEILKSEKKEGLAESAKSVKANYPESSYAILSAFQLAKLAVDESKLDEAAAELNWVIEKHPTSELAPVAKIRLARILIEQDKADSALPLVSMEEGTGYYSLASLVKGDALLALDKKADALEAYKAATNDASIVAQNPSLQIKIDQLTAQVKSSEGTN